MDRLHADVHTKNQSASCRWWNRRIKEEPVTDRRLHGAQRRPQRGSIYEKKNEWRSDGDRYNEVFGCIDCMPKGLKQGSAFRSRPNRWKRSIQMMDCYTTNAALKLQECLPWNGKLGCRTKNQHPLQICRSEETWMSTRAMTAPAVGHSTTALI